MKQEREKCDVLEAKRALLESQLSQATQEVEFQRLVEQVDFQQLVEHVLLKGLHCYFM